ncbi:TrbG/VirB9 family P-type conjugative transfer protein [Francisella philomiragia]|uniref:TrbG/VirB9 family P-type conjugative transfer protein n=1 Tax=Francisella philomiragia TaxID=28110 RepID=UPI001904389C|nr:TrbG/VirB9 family P-type conjugative transfer protein [Francisella philomiragia]MBK2257576.1 TrbG/VirB9 family P-type conjugative transfer protein [Francisella philomiragia]MBK2270304.1 TrbG/VirB9 family P-type conjugative transfer protein [Francisella philomiragia]MBK2272108.1 TrbG/VirB9 family P-type conjugative transfer protein [Francisella philomiragia]MBK2275947.1 TrbG/VirB9 family P-type conjugative transfer protein [Francisella philomiragia]MBK2295490.1 TrbG/VirB9 family P-type conju
MKLKYLLPLLLSVSATSVYAETKPVSSSVDTRVQRVAFNPNQITKIEVAPLISTFITLGDERIKHVTVGDPDAFAATELKSAPNTIKVKAIADGKVSTNMTVLTDQHDYYFMLDSDPKVPESEKAIAIKFTYPEQELEMQNKDRSLAAENKQITKSIKDARLDPDNYNWDYTYSGNTLILPQQVYDDGSFTYFRLRDKQAMPAFYKVNINGDLTMLDHQVRGDYVVIHETAPQYYLKAGELGVNIFDKKLVPAALKNKV